MHLTQVARLTWSSLAQRQLHRQCVAAWSSALHLPTTASGDAQQYVTVAQPTFDDLEQRRKLVNKMIYRSKQRGWLELDLLVGLWAEEQIPCMNVGMLESYAAVLEEENPDLFKWLTGQLQAPEHMLQNPAFTALRSHVKHQMLENSDASTHAPAGQDWVRGWDDNQKNAAAAGTKQ